MDSVGVKEPADRGNQNPLVREVAARKIPALVFFQGTGSADYRISSKNHNLSCASEGCSQAFDLDGTPTAGRHRRVQSKGYVDGAVITGISVGLRNFCAEIGAACMQWLLFELVGNCQCGIDEATLVEAHIGNCRCAAAVGVHNSEADVISDIKECNARHC